jgi:putative ABC transport system permease protein
MTLWLLVQTVRRAPRRLALAAVGVAFPVALLAATLLYVDLAVHAMTATALEPVQVEMRALATSLNVDLTATARRLARVPGVERVDRFAAAEVVVGAAGGTRRATARLYAVDPAYLVHHPWVRTTGTLAGGALLNETLRTATGAGPAVTISLPGKGGPLVTVPVTGGVDLRRANTWLAIPTGEVQGDIAVVPRALVIDYATFSARVLPALAAGLGPVTPVLNPGLTDLPPVEVEAHVELDHAAYPSDPGRAAAWSAAVQRLLERQAPGSVVVADDAAEVLTLARADATNAEILFLLLGVPGVLVAVALGLAAESALAAAHRREDALLRLRGATERQLARLTAAQAALAGTVGVVAGLVVGTLTAGAAYGRPVWREVPAGRLATTVGLTVLVAAAMVALRVARLLRAGRRTDVVTGRRMLEPGWSPVWRRTRLELVLVGLGLVILAVNLATGGLRQTTIEGPPLALAFYVLLAPLLLWVGVTLLAVRGLLWALAAWSRPDRARPLTSWRAAELRWLGRRPARTAVALLLGTLAVAFGTEALSFVATYTTAKHADAQAAFGADLRLTPTADSTTVVPPLGPDVVATSPVRFVPARAGSDRKTLLAIDLSSYARASTVRPRLLSGRGVEALAADPLGIVVAPEIARGFVIGPGDTLPVTVFPDDGRKSRNVNFHVVGVYRSFPPTDPISEMVISTAALPSSLLPAPESFLARVVPGRAPASVATAVREGPVGRGFEVAVLGDLGRAEQRTLTALRLGPLGRMEAIGAALVAGVGIAVLGAFLVLERRREFAVLRTLGADTARVLTGPGQEVAIAVGGSIALGVPIGLGLTVLAVRVLGLFFVLPPPLLDLAWWPLGAFLLLVAGLGAVALAAALVSAARAAPAAVLREP